MDVQEYSKVYAERRLKKAEDIYKGLEAELFANKNKEEKFKYVLSRIAFLRADFETLTEHMLSNIIKQFKEAKKD
jgi:hypothetical protein